MLKKILGLGAGALLLFSVAAPALAASLTQAQVSAIVGLLQSFGADQSVVTNVQATLNGQATVGTSNNTGQTSNESLSCVTLANTLSTGDTDTNSNWEVTKLQRFLGISPTTGTFGPLTLRAVERWQLAHGVVVSSSDSGYGIFGPKSRKLMGCNSSQVSAVIPVIVPVSIVPTVPTTPIILTPASTPVPTPPPTQGSYNSTSCPNGLNILVYPSCQPCPLGQVQNGSTCQTGGTAGINLGSWGVQLRDPLTGIAAPEVVIGGYAAFQATTGTPTRFDAGVTDIGDTAVVNTSFPNFFQLSTGAFDGSGVRTDFAPQYITNVAAAPSPGVPISSSAYTFTTPGQYAIRFCVNKLNSTTAVGPIIETVTNDNCSLWSPVSVTAN